MKDRRVVGGMMEHITAPACRLYLPCPMSPHRKHTSIYQGLLGQDKG